MFPAFLPSFAPGSFRVNRRQPLKQSRRRILASTPPPSAPSPGIATLWPPFAAKMKSTGEVPPLSAWHSLLDSSIDARDDPKKAIWLLNLMRDAGLKPTAVTYDKILSLCAQTDDRNAAFLLVELMFEDKVLLGDVELPQGMETVLRNILPPEAFE